jgi:hypothetical protein
VDDNNDNGNDDNAGDGDLPHQCCTLDMYCICKNLIFIVFRPGNNNTLAHFLSRYSNDHKLVDGKKYYTK